MANTHKLPTFSYNIEAWLLHVDASWPPEYKEEEKFRALLLALPTDLVTLIHGLASSETADDRYKDAKAALLQALGKPKQVYVAELEAIQASAQRPSLLLSRIKSLSTAAGVPLPDELLRHRLLQLLPSELHLHLASLPPAMTLQEFVKRADTLHDAHVASTTLAKPPFSTPAPFLGNSAPDIPPRVPHSAIYPPNTGYTHSAANHNIYNPHSAVNNNLCNSYSAGYMPNTIHPHSSVYLPHIPNPHSAVIHPNSVTSHMAGTFPHTTNPHSAISYPNAINSNTTVNVANTPASPGIMNLPSANILPSANNLPMAIHPTSGSVTGAASPASVNMCAKVDTAESISEALAKITTVLTTVVNRIDNCERRLSANHGTFPTSVQPRNMAHVCYYHRRFGDRATKCEQPCTFSKNA